MLSINFTDTKKRIDAAVGNFLKGYGFTREEIFSSPAETLYGFVRKDKFSNKQIISMRFYKNKNRYGIEVFTNIFVKNIADFFRNAISLQYDENISVLSPDLGGLIAHKDKGTDLGGSRNQVIYLINNDSDIDLLSTVIPERIKEYVFPYLDENSSIDRMDKLLNSNIEQVSLHHFFAVTKACFGIMIARINNNPHLQELIKQFRENLKPAKQKYQDEYEKIVSLVTQPSFSLSAEIDFPKLLKK